MQKNYKKAIVFALCLTMLTPLGSMAVSSTSDEVSSAAADSSAAETTDSTAADETADSDAAVDSSADPSADSTADSDSAAEGDSSEVTSEADDSAAETDSAAEDVKEQEEEEQPITDDEALAMAEKALSNDKLEVYLDEKNERLAVKVKSSGSVWWSSPINVDVDTTILDADKGRDMASAQRKQVASTSGFKIGDVGETNRGESSVTYTNKCTVKFDVQGDKIVETVQYRIKNSKNKYDIAYKINYELGDDYLYAYVDKSDIEEVNTSSLDGHILTKIEIMPYFAAADSQTDGYMIIPDGTGAVINYNNGKQNYQDYSQQVYGRDYTAVPLNAPRITQQAYLPVMATVSGNKGVVMVASDGDANVYAHAQVCGQEKQAYNNCYFEFEFKSTDSFFMSGDSSTRLTVFEKGKIKTDRFGVKYYPIDSESGDLSYADCAEVYRNYLINEKGLEKKATANNNDLYLDLYGGVMKDTSILGIPFNLKTEITGFNQAKELINSFKDDGVSSMTVNYNDWTDDAIKKKIATEADPSGTLGGSGDFEDLMGLDENVEIVPSLNNFTMSSSSWGYMTLTSTAIRVSNAYSRQSSYSPAFGVAEKGVAPALLTPNKYSDVFSEMLESYEDEKLDAVGFGYYSTRLVSDFTNSEPSSRSNTMKKLLEGYEKAKGQEKTVYASGANAYVLPYVNKVSNIPVYSSSFNITDYDIPFYQMVIHGYLDYAGTSVNKSSNTDEVFYLSLASGSQIHYDLTYVDADTLQDTDYDELYYTHYEGWTDMAAKQYKAAQEILAGVSDYTITKYERNEDGTEFTTTYSKDGQPDVVIKVNTELSQAEVDGKIIPLEDCVEGGIAE
ncbi:MAG: hypothetical protein IJM87_05620 [Ruminococcus sp.]|nr:hypothetical protein [Ruminococcus sp.]